MIAVRAGRARSATAGRPRGSRGRACASSFAVAPSRSSSSRRPGWALASGRSLSHAGHDGVRRRGRRRRRRRRRTTRRPRRRSAMTAARLPRVRPSHPACACSAIGLRLPCRGSRRIVLPYSCVNYTRRSCETPSYSGGVTCMSSMPPSGDPSAARNCSRPPAARTRSARPSPTAPTPSTSGLKALNARRGAENFTLDDARRGHALRPPPGPARLPDREHPHAARRRCAARSRDRRRGVGGGRRRGHRPGPRAAAARCARELPDVRVHASTQINAHNAATVAVLGRARRRRASRSRARLALEEIAALVAGIAGRDRVASCTARCASATRASA